MRNVIFQAALLMLCGGCALFDSDDVCTLVGGRSGLTVRFSHVTSPITRVEVSPYHAGEQPAYVFDCTIVTGGCSNAVFFPEYSAPGAVISVFTATGSQSGAITLQYHKTYPNGPGCEPEDLNAVVTIDVRNGLVTNTN